MISEEERAAFHAAPSRCEGYHFPLGCQRRGSGDIVSYPEGSREGLVRAKGIQARVRMRGDMVGHDHVFERCTVFRRRLRFSHQ